ncbi:hypothetical protein [Methylobacterium nonmethylotrophicum]|uniref:Helix-turn-helix domain-containing protein n=1 Tax=Methylobacterium nonmethylotrophicum TaxID=1141884 RepID=A0A4Z0NXR0_9HYPH|nr:hypothetical protein [Methylobacterium nonmethylotrophicum]TGE02435.1 hypothetical protein EU555_01300 [Methylobacterium nonmethylotrophicum]
MIVKRTPLAEKEPPKPKRRYASTEDFIASASGSTYSSALNEAPDNLSFNLDDAARHIGVDRSTLDALIADDWLQTRRIKDTLVVRRLDLAALLDSIEAESFRGPVPPVLKTR